MLEEEVKPLFAKYDKDQSGNIDAEELNTLSAELGHPLNEEQLADAMKDLDIDGDGVISLDEFNRWFFSGMKSYGGIQRSFLKLKKRGTKLLGALNIDPGDAVEGEIKMRNHSFKLGFNSPANPKSTIQISGFPYGKRQQSLKNELGERVPVNENI